MREWQKKTLVSVVTLVVFFSVLEFAVWRNVLDKVPLRLHQQLGRLEVFAQTSKASIEPKDYTMIIGDSNAEGLGDWLMRVVANGNPPHNAAHALHERTGRDVIAAGVRGGHPSFEIYNTIRVYTRANQYMGLTLPPPSDILFYFTASNDISDEMVFFRNSLPEDLAAARDGDMTAIREAAERLARSGESAGRRNWHIFRNFHMIDTWTKFAKLVIHNFGKDSPGPLASSDPMYRIGAAYREDWSRYADTNVHFRTDSGVRPYPRDTLEPFPFRTEKEVSLTAKMVEAALGIYRRAFPAARIWVVYIAPVIVTYDIVEKTVVLHDRKYTGLQHARGRRVTFPTAELMRKNDLICVALRSAAARGGAEFIDTAPRMRERSKVVGHLHGPNDPGHMNEAGYRALADAVIDGMAGRLHRSCDLSVAAPAS